MNEIYIQAMKDAIRRTHGCPSRYVQTVRVKEEFRGQTVWEGDVEVFDLPLHPQACQCYTWRYKNDDGTLQYVAILKVPPVDSPHRAVQAFIVGQGNS